MTLITPEQARSYIAGERDREIDLIEDRIILRAKNGCTDLGMFMGRACAELLKSLGYSVKYGGKDEEGDWGYYLIDWSERED